MKEKLGQEQAFADEYNTGISKRFYAACMAMQGVMANTNSSKQADGTPQTYKSLAEIAFSAADALLRQENL